MFRLVPLPLLPCLPYQQYCYLPPNTVPVHYITGHQHQQMEQTNCQQDSTLQQQDQEESHGDSIGLESEVAAEASQAPQIIPLNVMITLHINPQTSQAHIVHVATPDSSGDVDSDGERDTMEDSLAEETIEQECVTQELPAQTASDGTLSFQAMTLRYPRRWWSLSRQWRINPMSKPSFRSNLAVETSRSLYCPPLLEVVRRVFPCRSTWCPSLVLSEGICRSC